MLVFFVRYCPRTHEQDEPCCQLIHRPPQPLDHAVTSEAFINQTIGQENSPIHAWLNQIFPPLH